MFILTNYPVAVVFCIITMLCWGSWANTQKLAARSWRFELYYWDYVIGILLMALLFAFTLGSSGKGGRSFLADLFQADLHHLRSAFIGGIVFNLANILLIAAIAISGMSVAFPVGIGIALIWGVIDNYFVNPSGNVVFIIAGVAHIAIGIIMNAIAYQQVTEGTRKFSNRGLVLSIIAGILMAQFYGFVVKGMAIDFTMPAGKLTPYSSMVVFAAGILTSNFLFNTVLMKNPVQGSPVFYADYFNGSGKNHLTGILGGAIWCVGMTFSIIASDIAGPAVSYGLGQGAVLVAAIWGVFIWKEFVDARKITKLLLYGMFASFFIGLALLVYSKLA